MSQQATTSRRESTPPEGRESQGGSLDLKGKVESSGTDNATQGSASQSKRERRSTALNKGDLNTCSMELKIASQDRGRLSYYDGGVRILGHVESEQGACFSISCSSREEIRGTDVTTHVVKSWDVYAGHHFDLQSG